MNATLLMQHPVFRVALLVLAAFVLTGCNGNGGAPPPLPPSQDSPVVYTLEYIGFTRPQISVLHQPLEGLCYGQPEWVDSDKDASRTVYTFATCGKESRETFHRHLQDSTWEPEKENNKFTIENWYKDIPPADRERIYRHGQGKCGNKECALQEAKRNGASQLWILSGYGRPTFDNPTPYYHLDSGRATFCYNVIVENASLQKLVKGKQECCPSSRQPNLADWEDRIEQLVVERSEVEKESYIESSTDGMVTAYARVSLLSGDFDEIWEAAFNAISCK